MRSHCPAAASFLVSKNPSRTCNTRKTCRSSCTSAAPVEPNIAGKTVKPVPGPAERRDRSRSALLTALMEKRLPAVPFLVVLRTDVYSTSRGQGKAKVKFPGGLRHRPQNTECARHTTLLRHRLRRNSSRRRSWDGKISFAVSFASLRYALVNGCKVAATAECFGASDRCRERP